MPFHGEDDVLEHFMRMESAYSVLLSTVDLQEYRSACSVLKLPLSKLIYNAYLDLHPRRQLAVVDLVEFFGGFFLYDSQGSYAPEAASRVVGALGTSQEALTLKELLARLRDQRHASESAGRTLELIRTSLFVAQDTASLKKRQALHHAISTALGVRGRGLVQIFEDIAESSGHYDSPLRSRDAKYLCELSHLVHNSVGVFIDGSTVTPKRGQSLPEGFWSRLREQIEMADRNLPEGLKLALIEKLICFYSPAVSNLLDRLRSPTDELLECVEQHVCPLVDDRQGRPRNRHAQRWMRAKKPMKYAYDIGHFLPHGAGGPKDINFFLQERKLNRGWSEQGKRYRWLENLVSSLPDIFYFVRPVYEDLSPIPRYLEWGVLLEDALAEELAEEIRKMPSLHLLKPRVSRFSWLISFFENFTSKAVRDLMESAEG